MKTILVCILTFLSVPAMAHSISVFAGHVDCRFEIKTHGKWNEDRKTLVIQSFELENFGLHNWGMYGNSYETVILQLPYYLRISKMRTDVIPDEKRTDTNVVEVALSFRAMLLKETSDATSRPLAKRNFSNLATDSVIENIESDEKGFEGKNLDAGTLNSVTVLCTPKYEEYK